MQRNLDLHSLKTKVYIEWHVLNKTPSPDSCPPKIPNVIELFHTLRFTDLILKICPPTGDKMWSIGAENSAQE